MVLVNFFKINKDYMKKNYKLVAIGGFVKILS